MIIHPGPIQIIISPHVTLDTKNAKKGDKILQVIRNTICENFKDSLKTNFTNKKRDSSEPL
jgi:hypothetical protein